MKMVVYEVNLEFDVAIAAAYREWLGSHIKELLALPGFLSASVHEVVEPLPTAPCLNACPKVTGTLLWAEELVLSMTTLVICACAVPKANSAQTRLAANPRR